MTNNPLSGPVISNDDTTEARFIEDNESYSEEPSFPPEGIDPSEVFEDGSPSTNSDRHSDIPPTPERGTRIEYEEGLPRIKRSRAKIRLIASTDAYNEMIATRVLKADTTLNLEDGDTYSAKQMSNAFVYQHACGIESFQSLSSHLETNPSVAEFLEFDWNEGDIPSRGTLRNWWQKLEGSHEFIKEILATNVLYDVVRLAERFDDSESCLRAQTRINELSDDSDQNDSEGEATIAQQLAAIDEISPILTGAVEDTRDQDELEYDLASLFEFIGILGGTEKFASDLLRTANKDVGDPDKWDIDVDRIKKFDGNAPTPRGYFDILDQHSWDEYWEMFDAAFAELFKYAERFGLFDRPVELSLDSTSLPSYPGTTDDTGDLNLPFGVTGGAKSAHTHYGYDFFTVTAIDPVSDRTYQLGTFPKWKNGLTHVGVTNLVKRASEFVDIDRIYMDSEFRAVENLNWLEEQGIDFVVRYTMAGWRKDWARALSGNATAATVSKEISPTKKPASGEFDFVAVRRKEGSPDLDIGEEETQDNYALSDFVQDNKEFEQSQLTDFNEYIEEATGAWDIYVTNIDDASASTARTISNQYGRRNKIEPEYDYSKNGMIAKGGGRNYNVRVLYWMLGTLTLNAVKMIDLLLKSQNDIPLDRDQYAIPIKECVRLMFENPYLDPDYG